MSDPGSEAYPVWMPDSRAILFGAGRNEGFLTLARKRLDTGVEDYLLPIESLQSRPIDVSPDGRTLFVTERKGAGLLGWLRPPGEAAHGPQTA